MAWNESCGEQLRKKRIDKQISKGVFCKSFKITIKDLECIELGSLHPKQEIIDFKDGLNEINTNGRVIYLTTNEKKIKAIKYRKTNNKNTNMNISRIKKEFSINNIHIPSYVLNCIKESLNKKIIFQSYEIDKIKDKINNAKINDGLILYSQKKGIKELTRKQINEIMNYCFETNNFFVLSAFLKILNNKNDDLKDFLNSLGSIELTVKSIFVSKKKEYIPIIKSIINLIYELSSNEYMNFSDDDIYVLLDKIKKKEKKIYLLIYKDKNNKEYSIQFSLIKDGYIIEINKLGNKTKYFYKLT
ncbi:TPA: hypothetical protein N2D99_002009 [Clostridium botulinum]|nr:hypothetical protein [Clostridium botulinum]